MKRKIKILIIGIFAAMLSAFALAGCDLKETFLQLGCDHDYGARPTTIVESTCQSEGEALWTCRYCGKTKETVLAKKAHLKDEGERIKEPTCMDVGTIVYHCQYVDCGVEFTEDIARLPHNVAIMETVEPTCTNIGYTAYEYCLDCNAVISPKKEIPALGHNSVMDKGTPATCVTAGLTNGEHCARCGDVFIAQEVISAFGHTPVILPLKSPTCADDGLTSGSACSVCGVVLVAQEVIPSLGGEHMYSEVDGNCVYCGVHEHKFDENNTCIYCETHEHVFDDSHTCIYCMEHIHVEKILAAVAATCTEAGLTEGVCCEYCDNIIIVQEIIPAFGHIEEIIPAVVATCTNTGLTEGKKCSTCGNVLEEQEIIETIKHVRMDGICACVYCGELLSHSYYSSATTYTCQCNNCGHVEHHNSYVSQTVSGYSNCSNCNSCAHLFTGINNACLWCGRTCEMVYGGHKFTNKGVCTYCYNHEHDMTNADIENCTCGTCGDEVHLYNYEFEGTLPTGYAICIQCGKRIRAYNTMGQILREYYEEPYEVIL